MEYIIEMQTVVETPTYLKSAERLFSGPEREEIVTMVASDPECGELIQGTGGFRKVRVGRAAWGSAAERESSTFFATRTFRSS